MRFDIPLKSFVDQDHANLHPALYASDGNLYWTAFKEEVEKRVAEFVSLKIPAGHPVMIYGHKEKEFVVTVAACIMLELPYVPLDRVVPVERIKKIQASTGSEVVVMCGGDELDIPNKIVFKKGELIKNEIPDFSSSVYYHPEDPIVYIIFTSGSTGEPKGVQITRSAAASYLRWMSKDFGFKPSDVFINQAPFSFDLSVYELFTFLNMGSSLILNTNEQAKEQHLFLNRIRENKGSIWVSTPSFAYMYLTSPDFNGTTLPDIRHFLFCGEALPRRTVELLLERFPKAKVWNTYGPTEATVATTFVDVTKEMLEKYKDMPVGYSKPESSLIIDNETKNPEETGEIVIVGDNVTIGYFKNEVLNQEKCLSIGGKRAFRTGDYGYIKDDILFFAGRRDEQVKLNGYRIELGDITSQLQSLSDIRDAVTIPLKRQEVVKKIISFVTLKSGKEGQITKEFILEKLKEKLPVYMIPSELIVLEELPVNNNHKIDKLKLMENYLSGSYE